MPTETSVKVLSPIRYLLIAGGAPLVAFGIVMTIWGVINVLRPRSAGLICAQSLVSMIPGAIAVVAIYLSSIRFQEMAGAPSLPKPTEFATVTGQAMSFGFLGLVTTMIPVFLGICAFFRLCRTKNVEG